MKETLVKMKELLAGKWEGEGFAKFPTINNTAYTEQFECVADEYKDALFFNQKTWYNNETQYNGHTVFWDTGFILLKDEKVMLQSVQVGGRIETYGLTENTDRSFTFNSCIILNDPKSVRSQRIYTIGKEGLSYEMNMATHEAAFQNHLKAHLKKSNTKL